MKKPLKKAIKKKAWKEFSLYIRLSNADDSGMVKCVSCGRVYHYKKMQAGHFLASRCSSILFEKTCVHPQCYRCNICLGGNQLEYREFMVEKYGEEEVNRLRILKNTEKKYTADDYNEIYNTYKELNKQFKEVSDE